MHPAPVDVELAAETKFEGAEETGGFQFLAARDDARQRFIWPESEGVLAKDRTLVQVRGYEVCGYADDFHSLVVGLAVGGGTGERGKERGMYIKNPVLPVPDEVWRKNFHKAGEDDEINGRFLQMRLERCFSFSTIPVIDEGKRKSVAAG